jgi:hypothetical protein
VFGGGLFSLRALYDFAASVAPPSVPIFLGDVTHVPGLLGRSSAGYHYMEAVTLTEPTVVAAGPADLAKGVSFARDVLARRPYLALAANAGDGKGGSCLRGWAILDADTKPVILVSSVEESLQREVSADGGEVQLLPAHEVVARALTDARVEAARIRRTPYAAVLLHHGTVEETAALVRAVPGFTVAFAARGDELALQEPVDAGGTPVFFPGRRLRFAWMVTLEDGRVARWRLLRLGIEIFQRGSPVGGSLAAQAATCRDVAFAKNIAEKDDRPEHEEGRYVGAQACAPCHAEQCGPHGESKHARRPEGFTEQFLGQAGCLPCHTTGAFRQGGWKGKNDTSDLGAVSCEACHGPGAAHAAKPEAGYGRKALAACSTCHTPDRSPDFDAEALWKQWNHAPK